MQSQRRNKTVLYSKLQAKKASNTNNKKCSSVSLQTDTFPNFNALCNLHAMSMEEIKEHYQSTLKFLNLCHNFFNTIFSGQSKEFNTNGLYQCWDFKVPELPNYFKVLEFYLNNKMEFNDINVKNKVLNDNNEDEDEEQVLFDLKEFLPTSSSNNAVLIKENFPKNNSRLVKSEKHILKTNPSTEELKATTTSSNFEELFKTCNEFPKKSIEYLLENDIPLNQPCLFSVYQNKKKKIKAETAADQLIATNLESGDQEMFYHHDEFYEKNVEINTKSQVEPKGFNLLEYAIKYSPQLNLAQRKSMEKINRKLPTTSSQQKVNEMFKNISKESIIIDEKSDNILEKFAKLMNYEELSINPRRNEELIETTSSEESVILNDEEFAKRRFKRTYKISYKNNYVLNGTDDHVSD